MKIFDKIKIIGKIKIVEKLKTPCLVRRPADGAVVSRG